MTDPWGFLKPEMFAPSKPVGCDTRVLVSVSALEQFLRRKLFKNYITLDFSDINNYVSITA